MGINLAEELVDSKKNAQTPNGETRLIDEFCATSGFHAGRRPPLTHHQVCFSETAPSRQEFIHREHPATSSVRRRPTA
jgi:hypothetical protein